VLLDFITRSAGLLSEEGSAVVVVVNTLSDLLRSRIRELALPLMHDESGKEHTVLIYGAKKASGTVMDGDDFLRQRPCYARCSGDFELEDTGYHLDAFQGVAGFDNPGGAVKAAARLISNMGPGIIAHCSTKALLVHEPDQGHFPVWFLRYLERRGRGRPGQVVLSGRNILALLAAKHNLGNATVVPAVDILFNREALLAASEKPYGAVFLFPGQVTRRLDAYWEGLGALLRETGGLAVIALPSSEAERFDRGKPRGFVRLGAHKGDHKRHGFRAMGYEKR
jgi:hypothetical protein